METWTIGHWSTTELKQHIFACQKNKLQSLFHKRNHVEQLMNFLRHTSSDLMEFSWSGMYITLVLLKRLA